MLLCSAPALKCSTSEAKLWADYVTFNPPALLVAMDPPPAPVGRTGTKKKISVAAPPSPSSRKRHIEMFYESEACLEEEKRKARASGKPIPKQHAAIRQRLRVCFSSGRASPRCFFMLRLNVRLSVHASRRLCRAISVPADSVTEF
jgi:hypothetical protein